MKEEWRDLETGPKGPQKPQTLRPKKIKGLFVDQHIIRTRYRNRETTTKYLQRDSVFQRQVDVSNNYATFVITMFFILCVVLFLIG